MLKFCMGVSSNKLEHLFPVDGGLPTVCSRQVKSSDQSREGMHDTRFSAEVWINPKTLLEYLEEISGSLWNELVNNTLVRYDAHVN